MDDITEIFDLQKIKSTLVGNTDQIDTKTVMIAILNTLLHLNEKIEVIETDVKKIEDINTKMLSVIARVSEHEELLNDIQINSKVVEESVESIGKIINTALNHCDRNTDSIENIEERILAIENGGKSEQKETIKQMQDTITDLKCRSMKNNLIFSGLDFQQNEICDAKIQNFLEAELGINYRVSFGNVHRFGKPGLNGVRPIVTRFIYRREMEHVLSRTYKLKGKNLDESRESLNEEVHIENEQNILNILCINCCGLKSRINYPEFSELIYKNDIACFVETKTDDLDDIRLKGYNFILKNRKKVSIIYIPPEYTSYSSSSALDEIENEYLDLSSKFEKVFFIGDFNARTAEDRDFIYVNENEICTYDEGVTVNMVCELNEKNLTRKRNNKDKCKNRFGNQLLDFCKGNNLFIMNGRTTKDREGKLTCRNASVVDYCISNVSFLQNFLNFEILDFSSLYSDVHSPLLLSIKCLILDKETHDGIDNGKDEKIKKWDPSKSLLFQENIDTEMIAILTKEIEDTKNLTQLSINSMVHKIGNSLLDSAKKTFGTKKTVSKASIITKSQRGTQNKPWFDLDCSKARQQFRKFKRRKNLSTHYCNLAKASEKQYKKVMNKAQKKYRKEIRNKMNSLKTNDTKEYWKILNNRDGTVQPKIDFENLLTFFKELNTEKKKRGMLTFY
ncbi:unnamed protein product [Mytilus edulis]|uniref:Endonuclease/exonuclease/phosphatase domain-containing protein n=1 Tax=Mytilus edulis TaxID=6550 RepID=A0A8S3S0A3_MYTED|nr:unnamed protein product [Mytilus edulis]